MGGRECDRLKKKSKFFFHGQRLDLQLVLYKLHVKETITVGIQDARLCVQSLVNTLNI